MLGSILRVLIFGAVIAALAWGATFLIANPGGITITWGGKEYPPVTALEFVLAILAICFVLVVLFKITGLAIAFIRFLTGDENAVSRFFDRSRERRGMEALTQGMLALASGDAATARAKAERAERLLQRPDLTRLLNAQAATLAGDDARARTYWRALAGERETQLIGVKGLLGQAVAAGETSRAAKLAERAMTLAPDDPEVLEIYHDLQLAEGKWDEARRAVTAERRAGIIDKAEAMRREAVITLEESRQAEDLGEVEHARKLAIEAAKRDPSNVEAVVAAARHLTESGSRRIAARMVTEAWRAAPHPDLAAAFAAIEAEESPEERRQRFERLYEANPMHPESRYLRAELALAAGDLPAARKAIGQVEEVEMSPRTCAIMAAIARAEGAPEAEVRGWLARAIGTSEGTGPTVGQAAMLPLIVGEAASEDVPDEPEQGDGSEPVETKPAA